MIFGIRLEPARTHDARIGEIGILLNGGPKSGRDRIPIRRDDLHLAGGQTAVDMHVRPRPEVRKGRKRGLLSIVLHVIKGSGRSLASAPSSNSVFLQHDKHEPGRKPRIDRVGRGWRVAPGKILIVELDGGKQVRLEIGDPVARFRARQSPVTLPRRSRRCRRGRRAARHAREHHCGYRCRRAAARRTAAAREPSRERRSAGNLIGGPCRAQGRNV